MSFDFKTRVEFIDIKDQIRPFDLLAFRGTDLISHLVLALEEEKTGCNGFSHVGMVVTKEILDSFVLKLFCILISSSTKVFMIINVKIITTVKLTRPGHYYDKISNKRFWPYR